MSYPNFLIGAGASTAFGIPSMKELTFQFAQFLQGQDKTGLYELYNEIADIMNAAFENKADVESIMSVIIGLQEDRRFKENIGDFGLFALYSKFSEDDIFSNLKNFDKNDLHQLETKYKQFISSQMELTPSRLDKAYSIFDNLFGNLYHYYNNMNPQEKAEPYSSMSPSQRTFHNNINIFTTNYDTIIEKYFRSQLTDRIFYTGAREETGAENILDMDHFVRTCFSTQKTQPSMRIIKLHGSINWIKDKYGNLIQKSFEDSHQSIGRTNQTGYIQDEIMIYPLSQKQLYLSPFIQLFNYLEKELRNEKIWIVIGYSFRDIFIRNMFEKSIDTVKKIILVTPHSDGVKALFNAQAREKIIEITKRFGNKEDYENVNKEIAQKLKEAIFPG